MSEIKLTKDEFHLYVVEFVGFGVKVGISKAPSKRLDQHRKNARDHGREVGRVFISHPHVEARANERILIALGGHGREYMTVSYDDVVSATADLPMNRASDEVREQEGREDAERVSFFWPAGTTQADVRRKVAEVFG